MTSTKRPITIQRAPAEIAAALEVPPEQRSEEQKTRLATHYRSLDKEYQRLKADVERADEYDRGGLREQLTLQYLVSPEAVLDPAATPDLESIVRAAKDEGEASFARKIDYLQEFARAIGVVEVDQQVLSQVMLSVLDEKWKDHLYAIDALKAGIGLRGYGQEDPKTAYKKEGTELFEQKLFPAIEEEVSSLVLRIQIARQEPPSSAQAGGYAKPAEKPSATRRPSVTAAQPRFTACRPAAGISTRPSSSPTPRSPPPASAARARLRAPATISSKPTGWSGTPLGTATPATSRSRR